MHFIQTHISEKGNHCVDKIASVTFYMIKTSRGSCLRLCTCRTSRCSRSWCWSHWKGERRSGGKGGTVLKACCISYFWKKIIIQLLKLHKKGKEKFQGYFLKFFKESTIDEVWQSNYCNFV